MLNNIKSALIQSRVDEFDKMAFADEWHAVISNKDFQALVISLLEKGSKLPADFSCLALYCLGIVDEKPVGNSSYLYYDNSLPDIDIDFSDNRRHLVFEYMEQKYGRDHVARLGTVAMYQPRSALQEAGAALDIAPWELTPVAESLIERSSGDSRAQQTLEDTFTQTPAGRQAIEKYPELRIIQRMEGHPRHAGQHAAGVVLTDRPVKEYVALDSRTGSTHCDKKDAETLDLLKIDALGLTQLSVLQDAMDDAGLPLGFLETIPLDDVAAFEVLNSKHYAGIFQFNGLALQSLAKQIKFDHIEDIISITALARPGPLASGGANEWVKRKIGTSPITYPHPVFEPYLKETKGIVVMQEQVMQIGRDIGDLSWEDVTALRKAMSKSLGKEYFDQYGDKWKAGAAKKGIPPEIMNKVWDDLCAYGAWCISGETTLRNPYPNQFFPQNEFTIKELYEVQGRTLGGGKSWKARKAFMWDGVGLRPYPMVSIIKSGVKTTWEVKTDQGHSIRTTLDHAFLGGDGTFHQLQDLAVGSQVMVRGEVRPTERKRKTRTGSGRHNWREIEKTGGEFLNGKRGSRIKVIERDAVCIRCGGAVQEVHHLDGDHRNHRMDNLAGVCRSCHKRLHQEMGVRPIAHAVGCQIKPATIISISSPMEEMTYDVEMPYPHNNFLANDFVVHNSFNKSHSVAYGLISYWCAWFKAHHPLEFAAASLTHESDPAKQIQLLRELAGEGVGYVPVDKDASTDRWVVGTVNGERTLVGPLSNVIGIGPKLVSQIMSAKARGEPLPARAEKLLSNPRTPLDNLYPIKTAFARLLPDPATRNIYTPPTPLKQMDCNGTEQVGLVGFVVMAKIAPRDENEAVNVAKRGYKLNGPTQSLNLQIRDDSDVILAKVDRFAYEQVGKQIVDRGKVGKAMYAVKGNMGKNFRLLRITMARYIGDIDD